MNDVLNDALSNLEHDNYERSHKGYENRQADIALIRAALTAQPAAATTAPSDETLRLVGIIADKIEDGTLFQAGIFSRRDLAEKVRAVVRAALVAQPAASAEHATCNLQLAAQAPAANADALLDALRQIAAWPDGGNRYGQANIKRFAQGVIDAAMRKES